MTQTFIPKSQLIYSKEEMRKHFKNAKYTGKVILDKDGTIARPAGFFVEQ